jgi:hypothetical protein
MRVRDDLILTGAAAVLLFVGSASLPRLTEASDPGLSATFVDKTKDPSDRTATVTVQVSGVRLTDPATANETAKAGEGHLHYKLDDGPVIATTAPKLSFHQLKAGPHRVVVMLAGNDHKALGPEKSLDLEIK